MRTALTTLLPALLVFAACGDGTLDSSTPAEPPRPPTTSECSTEMFPSTFAALQAVVFDRNGCTERACHGTAAAGGLDLSTEVAYENLVEAAAIGAPIARVTPGDRFRSYLWLKLAAKADPTGVEISGSPMPSGRDAIRPEELEALRMWIYAGAPRDGTVDGTQELLDACLPPPEPITITPLPSPAPEEGVQFIMPPWTIEAGTEHEVCFATYYDISDQVPSRYLSPSLEGGFRFDGFEMRQDPQSHHLTLYYPIENFSPEGVDLEAPEFGAWRCAGGNSPGGECDPRSRDACGSGQCISEMEESLVCIGYGPPSILPPIPIGGAQQAQANERFLEGVYTELPMKGVIYWNSHAFNLTRQDHEMNGRLNYYFTDDARHPLQSIFDASRIFAATTPPFETEIICNDFVLPRGTRLFELNSHTHRRGQHFTVDHPDGRRLYESFTYRDPVRKLFDPPLEFDSPEPAARTLHYCSLFNNGVGDDGSPDIDLVTRASRIPVNLDRSVGPCTPVACVSGRIGAPCRGIEDDAACDSSPGAGDGWCDACPITGGASTENEMFILFGSYYIEPPAPS